MKLTVLTENVAGARLLAEHGLSYLIETASKTILFDTGHSDVFLKNASALGLEIEKLIDTIVLSHGHWDHGDGLQNLEGQKLITHPGSFMKRYRKADHSYIGLSLSKQELLEKFEMQVSVSPVNISDEIVYLGEVPHLNSFEAQTTAFVDENGSHDYVIDDSALAVINADRLVIVSGCAHAGICNTIEHAKKITGIHKVQTVIGGFHLKHNNLQTRETISYLQENNIEGIYPSHCTDLPALSAFYQVFGNKQVKTGDVFEF